MVLKFADVGIEARYKRWYNRSRSDWDFPGRRIGLVVGFVDIYAAAKFCSLPELSLWLVLWAAILLIEFINYRYKEWYSRHRSILVCTYKLTAVFGIALMRRHWEEAALAPFLVKILFVGSFWPAMTLMSFGAPSFMCHHLPVNAAQVVVLGSSNHVVCRHMYERSEEMRPVFEYIGKAVSELGAMEVVGWKLYGPLSGVQVCATSSLLMQVVLGFFVPTLILKRLEFRTREAFADSQALSAEQREMVEEDCSFWFWGIFVFTGCQLGIILGY